MRVRRYKHVSHNNDDDGGGDDGEADDRLGLQTLALKWLYMSVCERVCVNTF